MIDLSASQALKLLQDFSNTHVVAGEADLSFRQLSVLLVVYLQPPPFSVTVLAAKLRVNKPVITRALDALGRLDLIERHKDPRDARKLMIKRTLTGALFIDRLGERIALIAKTLPENTASFYEEKPLDDYDLEELARAS